MKRRVFLMILAVLLLALGSGFVAQAEILPPYGEGQIGYVAAILCEQLTMRKEPSTSSGTVMKLNYGDLLLVIEESNGWAYCTNSDSEDSPVGWVNADYIAIDPAWYRTDGKTAVYAWNDTDAPKVALLDEGKTLPILKQEGSWIVVSLRGASGWIHK